MPRPPRAFTTNKASAPKSRSFSGQPSQIVCRMTVAWTLTVTLEYKAIHRCRRQYFASNAHRAASSSGVCGAGDSVMALGLLPGHET
jgi:hypothetical protein